MNIRAFKTQPATRRFENRKDAIIAAAIKVLNREGLKGMTFADVAKRVNLNDSSILYYFKTKEDLAAACFRHGLLRYSEMARIAAKEADPPARLRCFLERFFEAEAAARKGSQPPLTNLSDMRALSEPLKAVLLEEYWGFLDSVAELFNAPGYDWLTSRARNTRAGLFLEQLFWTPAWLPNYDSEDFGRVADQVHAILVGGLMQEHQVWAPVEICIEQEDIENPARDAFLKVATDLVNERGYRGASVSEISSRLNVTKGAFYHHNTAKDDVIAECFERSFNTMRRVQFMALAVPADPWKQLTGSVSTLVRLQMSAETQLLRTSALPSLPSALRGRTMWQANRVTQRFASMTCEGIAAGVIRPVDQFIASQMISAAINSAADLQYFGDIGSNEAIGLHARPAMMGLCRRI